MDYTKIYCVHCGQILKILLHVPFDSYKNGFEQIDSSPFDKSNYHDFSNLLNSYEDLKHENQNLLYENECLKEERKELRSLLVKSARYGGKESDG